MFRRFVLVTSLLGSMALTALANPAGAAPPNLYTGQVTATEGNNQLVIGNQTAPVTLTNGKGNTAMFSAAVTWATPFPSNGAIGTPSSSILTVGGNTFDLAMDPRSALQGGDFSFIETFNSNHSSTKIEGTITNVSQSAITAAPSTVTVAISLKVK